MKIKVLTFAGLFCLIALSASAQTEPVITNWMINTTGIKGRHYVSGNSTPINDNYPANVQTVQYNSTHVYVSCSGIPSYIIGPFLDGNPSQGANNNNIYKIPLVPTVNNGTPTATTGGTIGVFINGVSLFDYRDGVSYNTNAGTDQGGPSGGMGNGIWNRDAIVAERDGFDCAKGHPAMTNYHHHQNPSAFNLDLDVISNVCDLYAADGLYTINSNEHAPLLGYAYDGFPIYGAYGYKNMDGTGGVTRMKSSYQLRNITTRTHYANGTDVADGPPVNANYPIGHYREDYEYIASTEPDRLDEHNGRFCITPEYPNGIYCYFATVDENWNSSYPYVVGPTFYGTRTVSRVQSVPSGTTTYNPTVSANNELLNQIQFEVFPNPSAEVVIIQSKSILKNDLKIELIDANGRIVMQNKLYQGSTICHLETETLYTGLYYVSIIDGDARKTFKIAINK